MQRNQVLQLLQLEGGQDSSPASPPNGLAGQNSPYSNPLLLGMGKSGQREGSMPRFAKDGGTAQGEASSVMSASLSSRRRVGGGGGNTGHGISHSKSANNFPAARPKIKVVLDIVASRKTLGTDPLSSPPYKLGQWVYQHYNGSAKRTSSSVAAALMSSAVLDSDPRASFPFPAPPASAGSPRRGIADSSVTSAGGSHSGFPATSYTTTPACCQIFVGISDSPVKMVGRDFLYPFKLPPGGGNSGTAQRLSLMLTPSQLLMHSFGAPVPTHLLPPVPYTRNYSTGAAGAPSPCTAAPSPANAGGTAANNTLTRTRSSSSMSVWSHPSAELNTGSPRNAHRASSADGGTFLFTPSGELPICIRQPPTHLEMIDQKRFIICHPHIE